MTPDHPFDESNSLSIEFISSLASITMMDPEVQTKDGGIQVRGMVDANSWNLIEEHDLFGASSRTRQEAPLPDGMPMRITLWTDQPLPDSPFSMPADMFVIMDAMHQVDPTEVIVAGLEGEVWEGVTFSDAPPWGLAITTLAKDGFELFDGLPSATSVRRDSDGLTVEFRDIAPAKVIHTQAVFSLPMGDEVHPDTFALLNKIHLNIPFAVVMIDAGDIIIRESIPDELGSRRPSMVAERSQVVVNLMGTLRDAILKVASGELTAQEAISALLGG